MTSGRRRDKKLSVLTVLALAGIAFDHLVAGLKTGEGHVDNRVLFMVGLLSRYDWREGGEREVDTRETAEITFNEPAT